MARRTVMILEDNAERIRRFEQAVASLDPDFGLRLWRDAPSMIAGCAEVLNDACLISLDHDLVAVPGASADPGTGLEVAEFLSGRPPVCPVIIHTSNHERRWAMHNEFRFAGWRAEIVAPLDDDWISSAWLPKARALLGL